MIRIILLAWLTLTSIASAEQKVFIEQIIDHPALNKTKEGIIDALGEAGFVAGENFMLRAESAQGNPSLAQQIASNFMANNPDIVVAIGTVSAQSFLRYARSGETKLVFSSVTDPLKAGLVKYLQKPGHNISGVSNFVALEPQLKLFKHILPEMKSLGFLYNPGEANSVSLLALLREIAPQFQLDIIPQVASKTSEVAQSAAMLAGSVDAIFISNDNTALGALSMVIKIAEKAQIPVLVSDTDAVSLGALAALGPNQYQVGLQTGRMVAKALHGADLGLLPVEFPATTELHLNLSAAKKLGLKIKADIIAQADKVIDSDS